MHASTDTTTESKIMYARERFDELIKTYCDEKEERKREDYWYNLTVEQKEGLKSMEAKTNQKEVVNFTTDKSSKMCTDSPENYIESMKPHIENMEEVTEKEYYDIENLLNCHMNAWCNIIHTGYRVRSAYQSTNNNVPPEYGLRKDHKVYDDPVKGPPTRLVCGAVSSCNYRISYFVSNIIKPFITLAEEACDSSEDMLYRVKECNENQDLEGCMIGSFDVDALYPSIDIDFAIEKCLELIPQSEVEFKSIDASELGLYLALTMDKKERIK